MSVGLVTSPTCDVCGVDLVLPRDYQVRGPWSVCPNCGLTATKEQCEDSEFYYRPGGELYQHISTQRTGVEYYRDLFVTKKTQRELNLHIRGRDDGHEHTVEDALRAILQAIREAADAPYVSRVVMRTACIEARHIYTRAQNRHRLRDIAEAAIEIALRIHHLPPAKAKHSRSVAKILRNSDDRMTRVKRYLMGITPPNDPQMYQKCIGLIEEKHLGEKLTNKGYSPITIAMAVFFVAGWGRYGKDQVVALMQGRFGEGSVHTMRQALEILRAGDPLISAMSIGNTQLDSYTHA